MSRKPAQTVCPRALGPGEKSGTRSLRLAEWAATQFLNEIPRWWPRPMSDLDCRADPVARWRRVRPLQFRRGGTDRGGINVWLTTVGGPVNSRCEVP